VAIGDSFTEGVGDEREDGTPRGWADRVAEKLTRVQDEPVHYANLAIRGRLLGPIIDEQLDAALSLEPTPTLISFNGGGNDMMRPRQSQENLVALIMGAVERCRAAGIDTVVLSGADPSGGLPLGGLVRKRAGLLTAAISGLVESAGATFVDAFNDPELPAPGYWSADRLHLNSAGHKRVSNLVIRGLGYETGDLPAPPAAARRTPRGEALYYREHVLPWIGRRLTGRSSGDGRAAKFGDWTPVVPAAS